MTKRKTASIRAEISPEEHRAALDAVAALNLAGEQINFSEYVRRALAAENARNRRIIAATKKAAQAAKKPAK